MKVDDCSWQDSLQEFTKYIKTIKTRTRLEIVPQINATISWSAGHGYRGRCEPMLGKVLKITARKAARNARRTRKHPIKLVVVVPVRLSSAFGGAVLEERPLLTQRVCSLPCVPWENLIPLIAITSSRLFPPPPPPPYTADALVPALVVSPPPPSLLQFLFSLLHALGSELWTIAVSLNQQVTSKKPLLTCHFFNTYRNMNDRRQ